MACWKANSLSKDGRLTLIKANNITVCLINHIFSCFKCPSNLAHKLDSLSRDFFWGSSKSRPVAWADICTPKNLGGLGIRPFLHFNQAALAKLGWKILTQPENLWVRIMKAKYLRKSSFFDTKSRPSHSVAWKGILSSRHIILDGLRWIVGDGNCINFWKFNWCYSVPLINFVDDSKKHLINENDLVSKFIKDGKWFLEEVENILPVEVIQSIQAVPIPYFSHSDQFIWGPNSNGNFSIRSAADLLMANKTAHSNASSMKIIWKLQIPPKIKIFAWQLFRSRIPTRDLIYTNAPIDRSCPFCHSDIETIDHIFYNCSDTKIIGNSVFTNSVDTISSNSILEVLKLIQNDPEIFSKCLITLYCIWKARNDVVFNNKTLDHTRIIFTAAHLFKNYFKDKKNEEKHINRNVENICWKPPDRDKIKLNFDGSVSDIATAGFILRNHDGVPLLASAKKIGRTNVLCAEASALRAGLLAVWIHGHQNVQVEGDSKTLIDCINNKCKIPWRIRTFIQDIKAISRNFQNIGFKHIWREPNFAADAVARVGHEVEVASWSLHFPSLVN